MTARRILLVLFLWSALCLPGHAEEGPALGDVLPDPVIQPSPLECAVLNICTGQEQMRLSDLPGRYLLVQIFSMYCPHCQASARDVNALYQALRDSAHADQVTMVGLGAGNSRFEVDFYREEYGVPFALFPDQDMAFYSRLNQPGTPFFLVLEKDAGTLRVRFEHQGPFEGPEAFLKQVFNAVGLTP